MEANQEEGEQIPICATVVKRGKKRNGRYQRATKFSPSPSVDVIIIIETFLFTLT